MIAIIYAGLSILPLGLLIFGSMFLKSRFKTINMQVVLSAGVITLICEFLFFNAAYAETIELKLWNALGSIISYFPLLASVTVFAVCLMAFCLTEWIQFKNKSKSIPVIFTVAILLVGLRWITQPTPSTDFKVMNQLAKPDCAEEKIREYADSENLDYLLAIIGNKQAPADVIFKLSSSDNEMIRYYATSSPQLSNERLLEIQSSDPSKDVRQQATNELKLNRAVK
jgi:hypothetical protein